MIGKRWRTLPIRVNLLCKHLILREFSQTLRADGDSDLISDLADETTQIKQNVTNIEDGS